LARNIPDIGKISKNISLVNFDISIFFNNIKLVNIIVVAKNCEVASTSNNGK